MDTLDGGSTSKSVAGRIQVIAGRITEVGEAYLILGSLDRIFLIDGLASGFHPGQRVTITAVLSERQAHRAADRAVPALDHFPFGPRRSTVSGRQPYV